MLPSQSAGREVVPFAVVVVVTFCIMGAADGPVGIKCSNSIWIFCLKGKGLRAEHIFLYFFVLVLYLTFCNIHI